ncbi:NAD(P)-binding domain-containing protein [Cupriavidus basilensis]|uniref:NAD(P)-binding domain-containing protein n=1 Tax=Cupriavidus basilensis TaxID=68895 RepID=A0ABT6B0Q4_9BURK|nr:NAD(P)-binding domain-containing protein [Cupriavidus basilensis]MDF3838314.1 NAD(P)-binding domain-containing protein [Cupriavidus basilensis]
MPSTDTVIIGAGPYGLSVSSHLTAAGVPHEILGNPMHAWRHFMPPGMFLRSEAFASNLYAPQRGYTMEAYCRQNHIAYEPVGMRLPLETFVDYGLWFQSHLVKHVRKVDVVGIHRKDGLFRLDLSDGKPLVARRVVIALGLKGFEQMPPVLQGLPRPYVAHSGEFGSLAWAKGKNIVLVGGGQSALGLAALLGEIGARVRILVRDGTVTWNDRPKLSRGIISRLLKPEGGLGPGWRSYIFSEYPFVFHELGSQRRKRIIETSWGPSGAWWLRDRVADDDIILNTEINHAEIKGNQVILGIKSDGKTSSIMAEHVIVATGFRVDMRQHAFLSQEIMDSLSVIGGSPELTRDFETSIRGLYVVGPASARSFGPVMRFVYGAKYTAPRLARHIGKCFLEDARSSRLTQSVVTPPEFVEGSGGSGLPGQPVFRNPQK